MPNLLTNNKGVFIKAEQGDKTMKHKFKLLLITSMMSGSVYADSNWIMCETPSVANSCGSSVKALGKTASIEVLNPSEKSALTSATQTVSPLSKGVLSYFIRGVASLNDVAYQMFVSNRYFGFESGSCQSWATLLKAEPLLNQFSSTLVKGTTVLLSKSGKSLVSTKNSEDALSIGWEALVLDSILKKAAALQEGSNVEKVYLPFNLHLTNTLTSDQIMHRVTLEAGYNGHNLKSVRIIDPQTALGGGYLSNANALCKKAFKELNTVVSAEYVAAGIQMPGTGNCQKMAAYIAIESAEGKEVSDLSIRGANAFCSTVHAANKEPSKASTWVQAGAKAASFLTRGVSSWWRSVR